MKKNIVNIINFIRNVNPRNPQRDLVEPVINQIQLAKQYQLPTTFLLQYDALINPTYTNLLAKEQSDLFDVGIWFEIVQPLAEKAGLVWRGREGFSWDWHANVGFLIGYSPEQRELLIDIAMEEFKKTFGHYPESVGSWFIDTHSLAYLSDRYKVKAVCMCRDQWGTDGYNLWGGYYNQAFYPSRKNMFSPAQSQENQINIPVFRMLGSDPIYQYDAGLGDGFEPADWQDVFTLEPVYPQCGGSETWVRWFFQECFNELSLPFGYTQAGQENSFGWEKMKDGLTIQMREIAKQSAEGKLQVETLKDSGIWFRKNFEVTPTSTMIAQSDWQDKGHQSVWFYNRFYRINFFFEEDKLWIRDFHIYQESYPERYLNEVCTTPQCVFDNLPVVDGFRWCGNNVRSGLYPIVSIGGQNVPMSGEKPIVQSENDRLTIKWMLDGQNYFDVICHEREIEMTCRAEIQPEWELQLCFNNEVNVPIKKKENQYLHYSYNGFEYSLKMEFGCFEGKIEEGRIKVIPQQGKIVFKV